MRIIIHKSGSILTIENTSDIVVTDLEVSIGTGKQIEIVNASPGYIKSKEKIELDLSDERIVKQPAPAGYIHVAFTGPRGLRWVRDSDQLVKQGWIQRKMIRKRLSK
ncbi:MULTISPECIES: hypothetical protein [unclassified Gordonia (in: high G+C Gram-positive bacteria)]|uniref:hypothetical protein n=1 Tax=unclassified Gordonia (in: high G+C Gram-positive bacteria) TaxID=2657482 RepID=UPI0011119753|nr:MULTISPECIES: hypothetical protein [unclassified Gordonia (in: high G+C Gram-positive bacteria)]